MAQLKILICGGGITGNALAFWLSRLDYDVTVIERYPAMRTTGLQIDLRGSGIEVIKRMGLEQAFRARAINEEGIKLVDQSDRTWAYFKANKSGKGLQSFTSDFEILRGDLCQLLYDATDNRAKHVFGTSVERYEEKDDCIEVLFSDGHTDRFDLLVGADGQGSRTRRMLLGPGAPDPIYHLGLHVGYFTMPRPAKEGERSIAKIYISPGGRAVLTRRHSPKRIQVYLQLAGANSKRMVGAHQGGVPEEKRVLTEIFRGAGWQTEEILSKLEDADDFHCEQLGVVKMDSWSTGRVVLAGDAAHCPSAVTGMGTTSGLVGAYILAGEIVKNCRGPRAKEGLPLALKAYDEKLRPLIRQVQSGVVEKAPLWQKLFPSSRLAIVMFRLFIAVVALLRLDAMASLFLREDQGWALPDYPEMVQGSQ